jgi:hypothetical protein
LEASYPGGERGGRPRVERFDAVSLPRGIERRRRRASSAQLFEVPADQIPLVGGPQRLIQ